MTTRKNRKRINRKKKTLRGGKNVRDMNMKDILELFKSLPIRTKNELLRLTSKLPKLPKLPKFTLRRKTSHTSNKSNDIELTRINDDYKPVSVNSEEPVSVNSENPVWEDHGEVIFYHGNKKISPSYDWKVHEGSDEELFDDEELSDVDLN